MTAEQMTERSRWIAVYVLCVGVLMIVLDVGGRGRCGGVGHLFPSRR